MYNRYIQQPDGSYRRDRVPAKEPPAQQRFPPPPSPPPPPVPPPPCRNNPQPTPKPQKPAIPPQGESITGFFKRLLPGDFDTGDMLVILLLLLMAGDCAEDRNHALLTLVIYLFL